MRATKFKHYGNDSKSDNKVSKTSKPKSGKKVKALSVTFALTLAAVALIVPTTTLAPDVDAYEDSKAASYSVGDVDEFAAVITDNCVIETTVPVTQEETTVAPTAKKTEKETKPTEPATEAETENTTEETLEVEKSESNVEVSENSGYSESHKDYQEEISNDYSYNTGSYLIGISNPDYNYSPSPVSLSAYDRAKLERLVMGEAGSMGYNGCALVAQCIRDAMNRSNTTSIDRIISEYQYYAPTNKEPNQTVKDAVSYIFDQNGSAVQHRILCFYTGSSGWHETQNFIVGCGNVRFFDLYA